MIAALDIGGSKLAAARVDGARVLWRAQTPTPETRDPESVLERALELVQPALYGASALGVAMTGRVIGGTVWPLNETTLPGWQGFALERALAARLALPVAVLNDARAAALGEARFGSGQGVREFMFVTVSTGIGAGLVLGGRLHLAANGLEGELGFSLVGSSLVGSALASARPLEFLASGAALDAAASAQGLAGARALADEASAGQPGAERAFTQSASLLAAKLADARVLLGISRVALGGSVGLRADYRARVTAALATLPQLYRPDIVAATLGADAGLVGAAAFVAARSGA